MVLIKYFLFKKIKELLLRKFLREVKNIFIFKLEYEYFYVNVSDIEWYNYIKYFLSRVIFNNELYIEF